MPDPIRLHNSGTTVTVDGCNVNLYDNLPGYRGLRVSLDYEDALTLARWLLAFEASEQARIAELCTRWEEQYEARHD